MGLWSGITTAISAVSTFISNAIPAIGSALGSFAKTLVARMPELELITKVISAVVKVIAEELGLVKENDSAEELGAKAVESDKKVDDFRTTEDYIEYLRNEVKVDSEKLKNMSSVEKVACTAIGIGILSKGIGEKMGMSIPTDFWVEVGKQRMNAEEVKAFIEGFKEKGFSEVNMADYLKGKLPVKDNIQVAPMMEETLKKLNPELSQDEIKDKLYDMKMASRENEGR